jgi:transcription elongation factor Elf1
MQVERKDGKCRDCSGTLSIVAVDDATMTVECQDCGVSYSVEPDAIGDDAFVYFFECLNARGTTDRKEVEHGSASQPQ